MKRTLMRMAAVAMLTWLTEAVGRTQTATVNWNDTHQRIDGFGASCAFSKRTWSDNTADILFSTNNVGTNICIGLSLLRNRILTNGMPSPSEISLMQKAPLRGARVWSTPWSPPLGYKDNHQLVGGNFLSASNQAYASLLANYVVTMSNTYGVNICALSVQNEPDAVVGYDSCTWTAQQIHDFVPYLYTNLLASNALSTQIIIPESESWASSTNLYSTAMDDPNVAPQVGIIANHDYVQDNVTGDTNIPAVLPSYGKTLWETEVANLGGTYDPSMTNAMYWAGRIHLFLTVAQVNAWHYWWLITGNGDNSGLMGNNGADLPTKRMYVVGQYSRFVRPGYYRIGVTSIAGTLVSAYNDTNSGCFAIVAVNTNSSAAVTETFNLANFPVVTSVTPWTTSPSMSLSNQAPVTVLNSSFSYTLPAWSVSTFVGQAILPPELVLNVSLQGTNAILSWSTNAAGFNLQYSTSLSSGVWNPVLVSPAVVGSQNVVTNPVSGPSTLFRLKFP